MHQLLHLTARKLIVVLLMVANTLAAIVSPLQRNLEPVQPDFVMGAHLLITGAHTAFPAAVWGEHLRYARQMTGAGGWVAQVVQSNDLNVEKWQAFLDDCRRLNLRPVLRLATYNDGETGFWVAPVGEAGNYAEIAGAFETFFYRLNITTPVWIVVGNEPNNGSEWGGRADPAEYARYYVAVAKRLKKLDKPLYLAMAALDLYAPHTGNLPFPGLTFSMMDAAAFLDGIFRARPQIMHYIDFWAAHVYPPGPFRGAPWEHLQQIDRIQGAERIPVYHPPQDSGIAMRGINGYEWERWYLENIINVKMPPILITEMGYRYRQALYPDSRDAGGAELDTVTAAAYIDMAIFGNDGRYPDAPRTGWAPLANASDVMGVIYFALAGNPGSWGHTNLLRVDESGQVVGTYPHYDVLVKHIHEQENR